LYAKLLIVRDTFGVWVDGKTMAAESKLSTDTPLTEAEEKRLRRFRRSVENRRGRSNPAIVPNKLARTSAFAPRRHNLSTDGTFESVYIVRPHTVVHVHGRELGSQHRDAIYAIFRSRARKISEPNLAHVPGSTDPLTASPRIDYYYTQTTWRDLLLTTGRTAHVNNLGSLLRCFEEIRSVSFRVYQGRFDEYESQIQHGRLPGAGFSDNLINEIRWDGVSLDAKVTVKYGAWVRRTFEAKNLVSLNADVYFRLRSDYAKSFWPFVDSQPTYTYVDDVTLAELAGRDYRSENSKKRAKFREDIVQAFNDMVSAGGLSGWNCEVLGVGRQKTYRYHYGHALERQGVLSLDAPNEELP
jgi:hypothetical protein